MGCAQSKGQGVSPEPSRAQVDHDDKLDGMLPAGGPPGALAGAPQARGVASELKAPPRPSAAACETPFDPSPEQGGSGQSSACLTMTGSGRSSLQRSRAKELPPAEPEAASAPPESSVERLAAVRLFCATPPADCCTSVSALLQASLNVPLAFVCLVGESEAHLSQPLQLEQQPGAAWVNLRRGEAPGELAACPQGGVLSVQDMAADARYRELPCVTGPPHLACLAAAPLVSSPGEAAAGAVYGSLVVADTKPRTFTAVQLEMLAFSAGSLVRDLEWAAQAARQGQAQRAQQALLRCAQETVEGHAESVLALDASQDGWPVLFCSKAAALAAGPALQQPAGVPFWQVFTVMEENTRLESVGSVWSVDSLASPISAFAPRAGGQSAGQSPADGAGGASDRLSLAENLRQAMGTPEVAQWLLGPGKPFSMKCRLRSPGQDATLPGSGGSGSLAYQRPLAGWAEEAADTLLPAPRASADARHPQHAAADASPFGRPARMGSLDSALPVMQQGSSLPPKEDAFVASFAPCTPALLRSLGAAAVPDLPDAPAGGSSGNNTSGGSSGGSVPGSLPPCWVVTLRPQPEITTCSLQRAHTACFSGSEEVEAFLRPEAFHDVRLGPLIASGAYGRAYRGLWKGQRVAIKIIPMKSSNDVTPVISGATSADISPVGGTNVYSNASKGSGASNKTPLMEALLSTSLDHPNIVKTLAFGMCQDHDAGQEEVWVLQELCTAGTLARAVEKGAFTDRTTGEPRLRRILLTAIEIASALDFLHSKSLVHADLSGNNVMLNRAGSDERGFVALVGDFGLARPLDLRSSICTGTYGTPSYMSPEMISEGRLSPEVDIFSAGVLLHEMLSGHRAWQGLSVIQVVNMVAIMKRPLPIPDSWPRPLQELVRSCLSHDPKARPTAKQLRAELTRLLEEQVAGSLVWGSP